MSTVFVSDRAVHRLDSARLPRFSRKSSVCNGWNVVRVPPRARVPTSGALFGPLTVYNLCVKGPFRGLFHWWRVVARCLLDCFADRLVDVRYLFMGGLGPQ